MKGPIAVATGGAVANSAAKVESNGKNGSEPAQAADILANPHANIQSALEKKLRNLGKRTQKLHQIKLDLANGMKLTEDQLDAISKASEVEQQVEFIKDLQKSVAQQLRQYQRVARQRDETQSKKSHENDASFVKSVVKYQEILKVFNDEMKTALVSNTDSPLTEDEGNALKKLYQDFSTSVTDFESFIEWESHVDHIAKEIHEIASSSAKEILDGITGARFKLLFDRIIDFPAFWSIQLNKELGVSHTSGNKTNVAEPETESDESSLNDFHQDSIDSNCDYSENNKAETEVNGVDKTKDEPISHNNEPQALTQDDGVKSPVENVATPEVPDSTTTVKETSDKSTEGDSVHTALPTQCRAPDTLAPSGENETAPSNKDQSAPKTINVDGRPRRPYNNRYKRDQRSFQGQGNGSNPRTYNNRGPRNYYNRRDSNPRPAFSTGNSVEERDNGADPKAHGNSVGATAAPRPFDNRRRFQSNRNGYTDSAENSSQPFQHRPHPRNKQRGEGVEQSGNGSKFPVNSRSNHEKKVPRVHQPYEYGLRFAY